MVQLLPFRGILAQPAHAMLLWRSRIAQEFRNVLV